MRFFYTLEEMNTFIEKTWNDSKYDGLPAFFSFVEVINGKPEESVRFIYEISPYMPLDISEIKDYYMDFENDLQFSKDVAKEIGEDTIFEPQKDAVDYITKRKQKDDFAYICPHCFRELDDCRCSTYPYHLVQIDKAILIPIRILNQKGYITTACCGGHIDGLLCTEIYIAFRDEHNFIKNIPEGAAYRKTDKSVFFDCSDKINSKEFEEFQEKCIGKLVAWANSLPAII